MKKFIILTRGRTGSTIICDSFGKIDGVTCGQELLLPRGATGIEDIVSVFKEGRTVEAIEEKTPRWPIWHEDSGIPKLPYCLFNEVIEGTSLDDYFKYLAVNNECTEAIGFKVLSNHLGNSWASITEYMKELVELGVSVIYLQRRDIQREALSIALASARKIYNVKNGDHSKDIKSKTKVDIELLKNEIVYIEDAKANILNILKDTNANYTECYFEDFLADRVSFNQSLLDFLEIQDASNLAKSNQGTKDGFVKVTPDDLSEIIDNYDEVLPLLS